MNRVLDFSKMSDFLTPELEVQVAKFAGESDERTEKRLKIFDVRQRLLYQHICLRNDKTKDSTLRNKIEAAINECT